MTLRILLTLLLVVATSAQADAPKSDTQESARELFLAAKQAYDDGRYDVAVETLENAYQLDPEPKLLINLGKAYQKLYLVDNDPKTLRRAVSRYRKYLKLSTDPRGRERVSQALDELLPILAHVAPEALTNEFTEDAPTSTTRTEVMVVTEAPMAMVSLDGKAPVNAPLLAAVTAGVHHAKVSAPGFFEVDLNLIAVEGRLVTNEARLSPQPGMIDLKADRGASVFLDGQESGRSPLAKPLEVPAGHHFVAVTDRGRTPWVKDLTVQRGERQVATAELVPTRQRRAVPWLAAATGAALIAAGATGLVAWSADSDAQSILQARNAGWISPDMQNTYYSDRDRRDAYLGATYAGLGIAAVLAAVGVGLYFFDNEAPPHVIVSPVGAPASASQ